VVRHSAGLHKLRLVATDFAGKNLPSRVVEQGFTFSREQNVPLAGFLGDTCVTLFLTDELEARLPVCIMPNPRRPLLLAEWLDRGLVQVHFLAVPHWTMAPSDIFDKMHGHAAA
jgi:hypothetical protein